MSSDEGTKFLQWALPRLGYRWNGFRKPRGQVLKRVKSRIQELNLSGGYSEYKHFLQKNQDEWQVFDSLCDITISKFFRDRKLWDFIREKILPDLYQTKNNGTLSIWSCGSCNGEEPYSIAIIADQLSVKISGEIDYKIIATDRNENVLKRAKEGKFPESALKELGEEEIERYFRQTDIDEEEDFYQIIDKLSKNIHFGKRDIRESLPDDIFDIVFCRNLVFTYFNKKLQEQFLDRLHDRMKKGSILITGSNEKEPPAEWLKRIVKTHPVFKAV